MNDRYDVQAQLVQAQEEINAILRTLHEQTGMVIDYSAPLYPAFSGTAPVFFNSPPQSCIQQYVKLTARLEVTT